MINEERKLLLEMFNIICMNNNTYIHVADLARKFSKVTKLVPVVETLIANEYIEIRDQEITTTKKGIEAWNNRLFIIKSIEEIMTDMQCGYCGNSRNPDIICNECLTKN